MNRLPFWNHNAAYYPWIAKQAAQCKSVLDVGCGNGALAGYISSPARTVVAIDPSAHCIQRAQESGGQSVIYHHISFEDYEAAPDSFDCVIFAASLHHMDAGAAIEKAKKLLSPGGILIIVGLSRPDRPADWLVEALRVIPAQLGSILHKSRSSEELNIPTSYDLPKASAVRALIRHQLPGAKLRRGLYYRYLLTWVKES